MHTVRENILLPFELDDRRPHAEECTRFNTIITRLGSGPVASGQTPRRRVRRMIEAEGTQLTSTACTVAVSLGIAFGRIGALAPRIEYASQLEASARLPTG
ncbi:MAG: hypothetical protein ACTH2U_05790 [Brevibacterium sp.]